MTAIQRSEPDLHAMVDQLVTEHVQREPYIIPNGLGAGRSFLGHHQARFPALIDQLLEPAPGGKGELSGTDAQARPAVRVEAHDTIELIASEAGEWLRLLGQTVPTNVIVPRSKLDAVRGSGAKRALVILRTQYAGLHGDDRCDRTRGAKIEVEVGGAFDVETELGFDSKDSLLGTPEEARETRKVWCCTAHHVEADVTRWWRQARIIAGWDSPTYSPFASCPVCAKRKGLRINLSSHTAVCIECREVWGPDNIGLLADHVRLEREGSPEETLEDEQLAELA